MRIGGTLFECAWSLHGDRVTIGNGVGNFYGETRDPTKGAVEDQARGMILKLWEQVAARQRQGSPIS